MSDAADHADGSSPTPDDLLGAVYDDLRDLAARKIRRERPGHVLQATALVHEAYLKLADQRKSDWQGKTHVMAFAAQAMHRILVDQARSDRRQKRGGGWQQVTLSDAFAEGPGPVDMLDLHDALERMRQLDERQAKIVQLKLFTELTPEEIAEHLDCSVRTVGRDWKMGKTWLARALEDAKSRDQSDADRAADRGE